MDRSEDEPVQDWNYWKEKAEKDFNVPDWYFDLPLSQERSIDGKDRFLEISSKFALCPESFEREENGIFVGIYGQLPAYRILHLRGPIEYYSQFSLFRYHRLGLAEENISFRKYGLYSGKYSMGEFNQLIYSKVRIDDLLVIFGQVKQMVEDEQFVEVEEIVDKFGPNILAFLSSLENERIQKLVLDHFQNLDEKGQFTILIFSLFCKDFSYFPPLFQQFQSPDKRILKVLLIRAYHVLNQKAIEFLESKGTQLKIGKKCQVLIEGCQYFSRPVEAYQILQKLFSKEKVPEEWKVQFCYDIDLFILAHQSGQCARLEKVICSPSYSRNIAQYALEEIEKSIKSRQKLVECRKELEREIAEIETVLLDWKTCLHYRSRSYMLNQAIERVN